MADLERMLASRCCAGPRATSARRGRRALPPRARAILEEIEQLNAESAPSTRPRAASQITAPPAVGNEVIAPLAVDFVEAYPEIELEIDLSERVVDLVAEGFDAAVRAGRSRALHDRPPDRRAALPICASPSYLERRGARSGPPTSATKLHPLARRGRSGAWELVKNSERVTVPIRFGC